MTKVNKSFKLDATVIECIEQIVNASAQAEPTPTQTKIVQQAVYHYYVSLFGEKALADVILNTK